MKKPGVAVLTTTRIEPEAQPRVTSFMVTF